jgi:ketosteroid isomerase-like protein
MSQTEIGQVNRAFEEAARKGDLARLASLYSGRRPRSRWD